MEYSSGDFRWRNFCITGELREEIKFLIKFLSCRKKVQKVVGVPFDDEIAAANLRALYIESDESNLQSAKYRDIKTNKNNHPRSV